MSFFRPKIVLLFLFLIYIFLGASPTYGYSCKKCERYDSNGNCASESEVCCDSGGCPSGYSGSCSDRNECGSCGSVKKTCPDGTKTCGKCFVPKPWYRLNSASLHKRNTIDDAIPSKITPFDSTDSDQNVLTIQNTLSQSGAGLVTTEGSINIGPYTSEVSEMNWSKSKYKIQPDILAYMDYFLQYSRKQKKVNIISSVTQIDSDTINIYEKNDPLLLTTFPNDETYVLLSKSDIIIGDNPSHVVNPQGKSIAIISMGTVFVDPGIKEINGILIGNTFDFAYGTNNSPDNLKIDGNLISATEISDLKRGKAPYESSSLYIVFNPKMYIDLIPHLSFFNIGKKEIQ